MGATAAILLLWLAFAASHMGLASQRLRPLLVARLGERGFLGLYSAIALLIFVPLVWTYLEHRHQGPLLWSVALGPGLLWTLYVLMGVAWVLVASAFAQPSLAQLGAPRDVEVRGVNRLTRHPLFMGTGLFGALHLIPLGFSSDVAFFAGFPVFALVGCWHQDRRKLATLGRPYHAWRDRTPFLPFTGRATWRGLRELSPVAVILGIGLTVAFRQLHGPLFGP